METNNKSVKVQQEDFVANTYRANLFLNLKLASDIYAKAKDEGITANEWMIRALHAAAVRNK